MDRNEAIKVIRANWPYGRYQLSEALMTLIPGIRESEVDRIRKEIIEYIKIQQRVIKDEGHVQQANDIEKWLVWLEKQGEQKPADNLRWNELTWEDVNTIEEIINEVHSDFRNGIGVESFGKEVLERFREIKGDEYMDTCEQKPADKVESKFHEGEWAQIDRGHAIKILEVEKEISCYKILNYYGGESIRKISDIDSIAHLWTIQDAKPGDVLYLQHEGKEHVIIYKGLVKKNFNTFLSAYCAYNGVINDFCFADVSSYACITSERDEKEIYPATKEQRNTIMKALADAGYTFDFKKKELKKIEQKPGEDNCKILDCDTKVDMDEYHKGFECGKQRVLKYPEEFNLCEKSASAWSEEDEKFFKSALWHISYSISNGKSSDIHCDTTDWLKSLKERMKGE